MNEPWDDNAVHMTLLQGQSDMTLHTMEANRRRKARGEAIIAQREAMDLQKKVRRLEQELQHVGTLARQAMLTTTAIRQVNRETFAAWEQEAPGSAERQARQDGFDERMREVFHQLAGDQDALAWASRKIDEAKAQAK